MRTNGTLIAVSRSRISYDLGLSLSIFVLASLAAGRIYRWPFDDEVFTLQVIARYPFVDLAKRLLNGMDVHPPLSYMLFSVGFHAGMSAQQLRWISLACTAGGLGIWHWLTLESIDDGRPLPVAARLLIAMLFGLSPMALSQGDALRWYPPLTLLSAITFLVYLRSDRWYLSGVSLGLAADVESLAIVLLFAIVVHRYLFDRKIRWREDATFALTTGISAIPSLITFVNILEQHSVAPQLTAGLSRRLLDTGLGFFGGVTLGLPQAWVVLLAAIATGYSTYFAIVFAKKNRFAQRILCLTLVVAAEDALLTLAGLSEPRAFLFLTPMITSVAAIGLAAAMVSLPELSAYMYALPLVASLFVIGSLRRTTTPFKRNSAIPFDEVIDFVKTNERGYTVILTSDLTVAFSFSEPGICAELYQPWDSQWREPRCGGMDRIETVIVVKGAPLNEQDLGWRAGMARATFDKQLLARAHFGRDDDAGLKSRLTGVRLSPAILDAALYR